MASSNIYYFLYIRGEIDIKLQEYEYLWNKSTYLRVCVCLGTYMCVLPQAY